MYSVHLQRHLCRIPLSLRTGQQAWVSTTSAINRGLRATRDDRDRNRGGRDRPLRSATPSRPPFRERRGSESGRDRPQRSAAPSRSFKRDGPAFQDRDDRSQRSFGSARTATRDRPSFGDRAWRSRDRPAPSLRTGPREETSFRDRRKLSSVLEHHRDEPATERRGARNRPGQRARRERAIDAINSGSSFTKRRPVSEPEYDDDEDVDEGHDRLRSQDEDHEGLMKHIRNATRQVFWMQQKEAAGEEIKELVNDAKHSIKKANSYINSGHFDEDNPADAVVSLFRKKAKEGTFLAGNLPDGSKTVIYVNQDGVIDLAIGKSAKLQSKSKTAKEQHVPERERKRSQRPEISSRERQDHQRPRQTRSREHEDDDGIPVSIPYTTAASEFLYGYNSVLAALRAKRRKIHKLYIHPKIFEREMGGEGTQSGDKPASELVTLAKDARVPFVNEFRTSILGKMSDDRPHNGVVLEVSKLPAPPVLSLRKPELRKGLIPVELDQQSSDDAKVNGSPLTISALTNTWRHPFILMLDGITDPGNLGNIIRTAHFYGVDAVAVATNTCANLSSAVLAKASSGACEAIRLLALPKPSNFVHDAAKYRWKIYAAVALSEEDSRLENHGRQLTTSAVANESPLAKHPCILMLGAEGEGLRHNLRNRADKYVSIEGGARAEGVPDVGVDSMNVSVATGVLLEAFLRKPKDAPDNLVAEMSEMGF